MNPTVTLLECLTRPERCKPLPVLEVLEGIRAGRWKAAVDKVRTLSGTGQASKAKVAKRKLPAILFSGHFQPATDVGLKKHSGLVVLDFDNVGTLLPTLIEQASSQPCVFAAFVSPSANGLKVVIRTKPADDAATHSRTARLLSEWAGRTFVVCPDNGPDVSRKCFVSHDPEAFQNANAVEWPDEAESTPLLTASQHHSVTASQPSSVSASQAILQSLPPLSSVPEPATTVVSFPWLRTGFVPTAHKQNNELMLKIARHLLDLKRELGRELTQLEVRRLIEEWFELTPAQFRSHPVDHYHMELLRAIGNAKVPLSTNPLAFAVVAAKQNTRPEWIQELPAIEPLRLIAAVCLELAGINGGGTFFVSSYQLGEAIDIPQRTAHHHLKVLIGAKRLKLVTQGTRNAANEYRLTV